MAGDHESAWTDASGRNDTRCNGHRWGAIIAAALCLTLWVTAPAGAVSPPPVQATTGMVVTSQRYASEVGIEILKAGGNAADAAVAVGYALAVVHPCCGNIGGGGFATLYFAGGKSTFVNFREKAPLGATETMYLDAKGELVPNLSLVGYRSVGVPGSVMGLETMLRKYGTMTRAQILAPAIKLAEEGFVLAQGDVDILTTATAAFTAQPNVAAIFLKDGRPYRVGERLVQKELAATLRAIAADGPDAFYKGAIADKIVAASAANGGVLSKQDFETYNVTETEPVRCSYRGYDIISAPPPSSGGTTICLILNVLESYPMGTLGFRSAASIQAMTEAMRHAYVDRNFTLGDPDFVKNPLERLLSKAHADAIRGKIVQGKATPSAEVQPGAAPHEGMQTTHYSIVDKDGNAVSVTYTINANFGARVIAGDTGFLLNDEMDDFTTKPGAPNLFGLVQGKTNAIAPAKRPLSSMSPTIVTRNGRLFMVVGSPGGARIITITLETMMNVIDHGMDIQEAVDAPRFHHQWMPDQLFVEANGLSPDARKMLAEMGYTITDQAPWGATEAIMIGQPAEAAATGTPPPVSGTRPRPGVIYGANDNRRPAGAAVGY